MSDRQVIELLLMLGLLETALIYNSDITKIEIFIHDSNAVFNSFYNMGWYN